MFRTKVIPKKSTVNINHQDSILALGSCFAEHIGGNLHDYKFNVSTNPFGTIFNPISIFKLINKSVLKETLEPRKIIESEGIFHHLDLHSDFSNFNRENLIDNANDVLQRIGTQLSQTSIIIYTFGTAIVHEWKETGEIAANCHKLPANNFTKRMLEIEEIILGFKVNIDHLKNINKNVRIILTVSPVRHQKETFQQNNVSKSILRIACEKIVQQFEGVDYFPSFEIMMDDLRDYRFYKDDMLHPNSVAVEYIWQQFQEVYFKEKGQKFILKWDKIRKAIAHKPFNIDSRQHQLFLENTIALLSKFKDEIDISPELNLLKAQLK